MNFWQLPHEPQGRFKINHVTIPIEIHEHIACALELDHVVCINFPWAPMIPEEIERNWRQVKLE